MRAWQVDDAVVLMRAWTDPDIIRWNPVPDDRSLAAAQRWIQGSQQRLEAGRSIDLCIVDGGGGWGGPGGGAVVGEVGLSSFDGARRAAMIGWWLLPEGRSRGLATRAVTMVSRWAVEVLGIDMLVARCATNNEPSHAVARRAGYVHAHVGTDGHDLFAFRPTER